MIFPLFGIIVTLFISTTQALECTVGYAFPDTHGQIPSTSETNTLLVTMTCTTQCLLAFVKTAQQPTGQIVASCASTSDTSCDSGFVLDVNTWTEIKCCSTDNCNAPNGNFPWNNYDWTTPRNPTVGTGTPQPTTTTTTDAPTDAPTNQPTQPTNTNTIQCTVGTSVPDGQGGVIKQVATQSCTTECYAIYTHSSLGPTNVGTIAGGCASANNHECLFQGTSVNSINSNQWVEIKCCNTSNNCNSQDWGAGQFDWSTPRGNSTIIGTITGIPTIGTSTTGTTTQPPIGTGTGAGTTQPPTGTGTGTGTVTVTPTSKPTSTPTSQPVGGRNNTLSSTGIHSSAIPSLLMSPLTLVAVIMISMML